MERHKEVEVLVIGAGQAGLAAGYYLSQAGKSFMIVDGLGRVGEMWRSRYDSLVLFTPRSFSSLPGLPFPGEPESFPTKEETADYLQGYAKCFSLPVQLGTQVQSLTKDKAMFTATTNRGTFTAKQVIVATGPFQRPVIPGFAGRIPEVVVQLHSSAYKNASQLKDGPVLIAGGGNSGAQIAVELSGSREVYLAVSHKMKFLPLRIGSTSMFTWFRRMGLLDAPGDSLMGSWFKKQHDPIFGLELKHFIRSGKIAVKPRVTGEAGGRLVFEDGSTLDVPNIVWCTALSRIFTGSG